MEIFSRMQYVFWFVFIFLISTILFCYERKLLIKFQFGQVVRNDGPETHISKRGTPTMGGIVFAIMLLIMISYYIFIDVSRYLKIIKIMIFIIAYGILGIVDDFLKIYKKSSDGLSSIFKFLVQIIFGVSYLIFCFQSKAENSMWLFGFLVFIIVGTDNGVNFTDGVDGLCAVVTIIIGIFFIILSVKMQQMDLVMLNIIFVAMLCAFLIYNHYPAKMFMGDAGSLLLGAYVAFMSIELGVELKLPIFGFIYMIEVMSVILQVTYFKLTHGKRIFKMAPIHHHFEKCGFSEVKVVAMFGIITIMGCIISLIF